MPSTLCSIPFKTVQQGEAVKPILFRLRDLVQGYLINGRARTETQVCRSPNSFHYSNPGSHLHWSSPSLSQDKRRFLECELCMSIKN